MKTLKFTLILTLGLFSTYAQAQNGKIRGTAYDRATGEGMWGVQVVAPSTGDGAVADFDGKFEFDVPAGTYTLQASFVGYKKVIVNEVVVKAGEVTVIEALWMEESISEMNEVVVTAEAASTSEIALLTAKKKSINLIDGMSSQTFRRIGDSNVGEAAKRITGVSVEGGKYIYVRGLGDRYTKTTLNGMDIPGLDPDRNSIQIDVFPTNLVDNLIILKSFTPDLPADFTGGIVNIETKDFPDQKIFDVSLGIEYNPSMHFNPDYVTYEGGNTDFLGFDDGTRELPSGFDLANAPNPFNSGNAEVTRFLDEFSPVMGINNQTSFMDYSLGVTYGDQKELKNGHNLGYLFTGNYKNNTTFYDDAFFGEYQNDRNPSVLDFQRAATSEGLLTEREVLLGGLAGIAYKTDKSKFRLTMMRLQNGVSRSTDFDLVDDDNAIGKSGFTGISENMEYNQRSVTNLFLNGQHYFKEKGWTIDWRGSSTWSTQEDPDIRRTPFTEINDNLRFSAGAAGNPSRLWRSLEEQNIQGKVDITKDLDIFTREAKLKFGASYTYKERDYNIVDFNINFLNGEQPDWTGEGIDVWTPETVYPNGSVFIVSGFSDPNPNQYNSDINNTAFYFMGEFSPIENLKSILGVRAENFVQRHTGRDQLQNNVLENEEVLDELNFFPSANLIYALNGSQNLRLSYSRTIARPSFKELSFAQILDPVSNRIFNGGLFAIDDWDGNLKATDINNFDIRWELFANRGQNISVSTFYKTFNNPIELVRLPQAQTNAEFQPRNVGDGEVYGVELEFKKALNFINDKWSVYGNLTFVESIINISETELRNRNNNARDGEVISETRNMQGQAPWIINAGITYDDYNLLLDAGLFYNVKGRTLVVVGGGIDPDVFAQPFHSLNFNMNKVFGNNEQWTANFSVNNILGDVLEQFYERDFSNLPSESNDNVDPQIFQRWSPGTSIGLGISYSLN